jgi:MYXO-CTERM domain-containing protein
MRTTVLSLLVVAALCASTAARATTLEVGPGKPYATPCAAIAAASAGDTIQVDGSGNYGADNCSWTTDNLTVEGVNGRPKIDLAGTMPSDQKGIFTIYANNATIDNFELSGSAIDGGTGPGDSNGAGIRHQGTNLTVKNCYIHDNQDGILGAPATANTGTVTILNTEFYNNGEGDGYTHNMYLGDYATVMVEFSYSHHSVVGHLLKSRAYTSFILYNRLSDEMGGTGSYELDLPNAGTAYVIGNVIEQSATSENPTIVTYGEEGVPSGYDTHLYFVNNTVLNDLMSGTFVNNATSTGAALTNDIFYGGGTVSSNSADISTTNYSGANPMFVDESTVDVYLLAGSPCINAGTDPGKAGGTSLEPVFEYVQPVSSIARTIVGEAIDIGAYEFGLPDGGAPQGDSGIGGRDGSALPLDAGITHTDSGTGTRPDGGAGDNPASSGGCGCVAAGAPTDSSGLAALGCEALAALFAIRRRKRASLD